jgi:hypothetical protein
MMKYFLPFLLMGSISAASQTGSIKGRVYNTSSNEALPYASVGIFDTKYSALTDSEGTYLFTNIPPGYYKMIAMAVGFERAITGDIHITNARTAYLDIGLVEKPLEIDQVVVKANAFKKIEESPVSLVSLGISDIERSPGGNRDISRVIQTLPGVASGLAYRNDLIIRGGGPSENRFILDRIEIPNLNHFGTQGASGGSVGIINSDFLREADLYTGAFPASKGNTLSSVLDMKLIDGDPDRMRYRAAVGASELALSASGPIGEKTTLLLSIRRSYLQFLFNALQLPFLPTFNDYTFKLKSRLNPKNELTLLSIGSLDKSVLNKHIKNPTEEQWYILNYLPSYDQWSYAIGAVYRHYRDHSYDTWVISRNMLNNESKKFRNNDEADDLFLNYVSRETENKLRYENSTRMGNLKLIAGAGFEKARYQNETYQRVFIPSGADTIQSLDYQSRLDLYKYNAFAQLSTSVLEGRLSISAGLRLDGSTYSGRTENPLRQLSPRASASWNFTGKLFLNANLGRYYQLPSYTTLGYRNGVGELINKENGITYIRADHLVAGLEYKRTPASKFSLEIFWKWYSRYPFSVNDSVSIASKGANYGIYGDEPATPGSTGKAYGMEAFYRDQWSDRLSVMLSYTYVRSEFTDVQSRLIPSAWDNRHILNLTLSASPGKNWTIGSRWRFVGGAPYTPYDIERSSLIEAWDVRGQAYINYGLFNSRRLGSFHQLDLRVDKEYFFKKWSLSFYLDIQNVYNFKSNAPEILVVQRNTEGDPVVDPLDSSRYLMKYLASESGTILPTLGIVIEL